MHLLVVSKDLAEFTTSIPVCSTADAAVLSCRTIFLTAARSSLRRFYVERRGVSKLMSVYCWTGMQSRFNARPEILKKTVDGLKNCDETERDYKSRDKS